MEFPSSFDMGKFKRTIPNKRIQDWPDKRSRKKILMQKMNFCIYRNWEEKRYAEIADIYIFCLYVTEVVEQKKLLI